MTRRPTLRRRGAFHTFAGTGLVAALTAGCAVGQADLERWETTVEGPKRLSAVVLFDKYPDDLRVQAALSLIDMKPRKGQRVGIERLVKGTLACDPSWLERKEDEPCRRAHLSPETRARLARALVPRIIEKLNEPPPPPAAEGEPVQDPSYTYKDAAYLMLTYDKARLITDNDLERQLLDALAAWSMVDFERKLNDQSQMFGMEQLLRLIGPRSVEKLPALIHKDSLRNLQAIADLVHKIGADDTKQEASKKLVEVMTYVSSDEWRKEKEPEVKAANEAAGFKPDEKRFAAQLDDFQAEVMVRIYTSMKKVGGAAVVEHCLGVAGDKGAKAKIRQTALAALEGHVDKKDEKSIDRLIALARNPETPLEVVDVAFRLVKQLPRDVVAERLYAIFDAGDWKMRRLAGATILQMSKVEHVGEFFEQLSKRVKKNFALPEARTYAAYIGGMQEGDPLAKLEPFMRNGDAVTRVTALAYYYELGTKKDIDKVKAFASDKQKVPECDEGAACAWECIVVGDDKQARKVAIETIGDFVSNCVLPKLERADEEKAKENAKDEGGEPTPTSENDPSGD